MVNKIEKRVSGVLLHPVSLPGKWGVGDIGWDAYNFVDFLADSKQSVWQMLPLTPTGGDGCPYNSQSAFAGNPLLISIDKLMKAGFIKREIEPMQSNPHKINYDAVMAYKYGVLEEVYENFIEGKAGNSKDFDRFVNDNRWWLDDYALFMALNINFNYVMWTEWPKELKKHDKKALDKFEKEHLKEVNRFRFYQWLFYSQWKELREYANKRGVSIMGDIPIFVAYNSADVWANQEQFMMKDGQLLESAGVPPDYFAKDGQLWGNPLYNWKQMEKDGFKWWIDRFKINMTLYDIIRIDHFRGFSACWAVPSGETTARNGKWVKTPGEKLFTEVKKHLGDITIVAEDLGQITEDVTELRKQFGFYGMKVLQFAFAEGSDHYFLPHNYDASSYVVYSGTHDNDTTIGWYEKIGDKERDFVNFYLNMHYGDEVGWSMMRAALFSIANMAIFTVQDILALGSEARFNVPGAVGDINWTWRYEERELNQWHKDRLRGLTIASNRCKI